jgi:zinc transporter ZupT
MDLGTSQATLLLLALASGAALLAAVGVVPLIGRPTPPPGLIGWTNAVAAGLMLGAGYALVASGVAVEPVPGVIGGGFGVLYVAFAHWITGTGQLELNRMGDAGPVYPYQVLMVHVLHSASEGLAIGVAMAVSTSFGVFMCVAIAVHNMPEATALCAILRSRGLTLPQAAGMAIAVRLSQVLLAVATFAVVSAAPALTPWVLGVAVGALIYLVMAELLPESYREAGHRSIALVTIVAMMMLVLLHGRAL